MLRRFGATSAVINESVDLLYNLVVLWSELWITDSEVWAEMDRRQALLGMAEKLPKDVAMKRHATSRRAQGRGRLNAARSAAPQSMR